MCVSFWTEGNSENISLDYVHEILGYKSSTHVYAAVNGFVRNLGNEPQWLHIIHRRLVEMKDRTPDWRDQKNLITKIFSDTYEGMFDFSENTISLAEKRPSVMSRLKCRI